MITALNISRQQVLLAATVSHYTTWVTPEATQGASSFSSEAEFYEGNPPLPFFCPGEGDWCDEDGLYDME